MKLNFKENLKLLRKENGITQDTLLNYLILRLKQFLIGKQATPSRRLLNF